MESSGSYNSVNSVPDETRRGPLEQAFRRRTVRDVLALVDDLDAKAEFAPLERAYVVYSVLKTRQYADEGARWANLGAIIFFVGIVCAALTPALVALTGMYAFSNAPKFHRLQFAAICASLTGTIAHASRPASSSSWCGRRDAPRRRSTTRYGSGSAAARGSTTRARCGSSSTRTATSPGPSPTPRTRPTAAPPTLYIATPSGGSRSGAAPTARGDRWPGHMYISTHGESQRLRADATTVHRTK